MNLFEYIALNNRAGASSVTSHYNMPPANTPEELASQLAVCVQQDGENALAMMASIHPDLELIEKATKKPESKDSNITELLQSHFSNANGQAVKNDIQHLKEKVESGNTNKELLIIGGIVVLGLAIIMKK